MLFSELEPLLPQGTAGALARRFGDQLLPAQELGVQAGALEGRPMVICAPTSSGKGVLAEMACLAAVARGKKAWHLTPLLSAAREQADRLRRWEDTGVRVALGARHAGADDGALLGTGGFDVAVCVYERFASLWSRAPGLAGTGCLVLDEAHTAADPARGWAVELACAAPAFSEGPLQRLLLTASLPHARLLARRLGLPLIVCEDRPVPLREGTFLRGTFTYVERPGGEGGTERFAADSPLELAAELTRRGERILYFCSTRQGARSTALALAAAGPAPPAERALAALSGAEPGGREKLLTCLAGGVAYHSAELTPEERTVLEESFRQGELRALVCTTTLAYGVNLPADTVLIEPVVWSADARTGRATERLISRELFEAAGGRAGRLGLGDESRPARAILLPRTALEEQALRRLLAPGDGELPPERPGRPPSRLLLLAAGALGRRDEVVTLAQRLPLRRLGKREARRWVASHLADAQSAGLLKTSKGGALTLTPAGAAATSAGLSPETAAALSGTPDPDAPLADAEALLSLLLTPDAEAAPIWVSTAEVESNLHRRLTSSLTPAAPEGSMLRAIARAARPQPAHLRALKTTCALMAWRDGARTAEVEERTGVTPGDLLEAASVASWLLASWASLAAAQDDHYPAAWLRMLAACVGAGLPEELAWVAHMKEGAPPRRLALTLSGTPLADPVFLARSSPRPPEGLEEHWDALLQQARGWIDEGPLELSEDPPALSCGGLSEPIPRKALPATRLLLAGRRAPEAPEGVRRALALLLPARWPLPRVPGGVRLDAVVGTQRASTGDVRRPRLD